MESSEVLPRYSDMQSSICSSEFSLIQTPEVSLIESGTFQPAISKLDLVSSLNEKDIYRWLNELTEDNKKLRECLQSSSHALKSQLSAMAEWHNSTVFHHQTTLKEAQDKAKELEIEKEQISQMLENLSQENKEKFSKLMFQIVAAKEVTTYQANEFQDSLLKMKLDHMKIVKDLMGKVEDLESKLTAQEQKDMTGKSERPDDHLSKQEDVLKEQIMSLKLENVKTVNDLVGKVKDLEAKLSMEQQANEHFKIESKELMTVLKNHENYSKDQADSQSQHLEQIDLLTARLLDCEQRLKESERYASKLKYKLKETKEHLKEPRSSEEHMKNLEDRVDYFRETVQERDDVIRKLSLQIEQFKNPATRSHLREEDNTVVFFCPHCHQEC